MQLVCNDVALDLYEGTGLQLKKDNPLFAFDQLSCERTTQFKLPCTPTNDRVFSIARIPAYSGEGMRRRFAATLIMGTNIKNGYLYVASFDGKDYTAIFVTGELVGLQAIKNLGKLSDLIDFGDTYTELYTSGSAADPTDTTMWKSVTYEKERSTDIMHPSIHLGGLYDRIKLAQNIQAEALTNLLRTKRIVVGDLKGLKATQMTFTGEESDMIEGAPATSYVCYEIGMSTKSPLFDSTTIKVAWHEEDGDGNDIFYYGNVEQFIPKQDVTIEFPSTWDNDIYIGYFQSTGAETDYNRFVFYGDRSFDINHNPVGQSLRGRTVTINKGQRFVFIKSRNYVRSGSTYGWQFESGYTTQCTFTITGKISEENIIGTCVFLQDNLPDITFIDLIKTIAAITGRVLNYTDANGITYDVLDFANWNVKYIDNIIEIGEVERTFADYAQNNIVRYNSETRAMAKAYIIDNDNLENEKDLQVLPFGEGDGSGGWLYLKSDFSDNVMSSTAAGTKLQQQTIGKNSGLQTLCDASTQIKVKCRMTMLQYDAITANTLLYIRGTRYVWTSSVWQKEAAEFTLAKIA